MIRIVTDSAADLTAEQLSVPGIFVVPLSVTFADGTESPLLSGRRPDEALGDEEHRQGWRVDLAARG